MSDKKIISSRSELLSLLSEACELEHTLACSYLYTAFTLKQNLTEGSLNWQQLQKVRLWAAQIYFVASEEMLHLAQVWNLLAAIGGTPYYLRPNFPQNSKYYPLNLPLELEPFGPEAIKRFVYYERPAEVTPERAFSKELGLAETNSPSPEYRTVGELYRLILSGFSSIPEEQLFIGAPERQIDQDLVDFPDIVKVVDRASAEAAIEAITSQGEGTVPDRTDCHYGIFKKIQSELQSEQEESQCRGEEFEPARHTIKNPISRYRGSYGAVKGNLIENEYTKQVAELFDELYGLMLRMLQYVFDNSTEDAALLRDFSRMAIKMMCTVIKPLGEALTRLPAGARYGLRTAGPAFAMSRHVPLPREPRSASIVAQERLQELVLLSEELADHVSAPIQFISAHTNLKSLS